MNGYFVPLIQEDIDVTPVSVYQATDVDTLWQVHDDVKESCIERRSPQSTPPFEERML